MPRAKSRAGAPTCAGTPPCLARGAEAKAAGAPAGGAAHPRGGGAAATDPGPTSRRPRRRTHEGRGQSGGGLLGLMRPGPDKSPLARMGAWAPSAQESAGCSSWTRARPPTRASATRMPAGTTGCRWPRPRRGWWNSPPASGGAWPPPLPGAASRINCVPRSGRKFPGKR